MDMIRHCREQELRYRQLAMYDPAQSWKWLAEAERWEHRAYEIRAAVPGDTDANPETPAAANLAA